MGKREREGRIVETRKFIIKFRNPGKFKSHTCIGILG